MWMENQPYFVMTQCNGALLKGVPVTGKSALYCHDIMQQCYTKRCNCDWKINLILSWHDAKVLYLKVYLWMENQPYIFMTQCNSALLKVYVWLENQPYIVITQCNSALLKGLPWLENQPYVVMTECNSDILKGVP